MLVQLTEELDAWGETWPAGTVLAVTNVSPGAGAWEVWFPTLPDPVVGTVTARVAAPMGLLNT